jgi:hypothetical protein
MKRLTLQKSLSDEGFNTSSPRFIAVNKIQIHSEIAIK